MEKSRIEKQFDFIKEIDKEKFIIRQTYLSDARKRKMMPSTHGIWR